jgi:hypothetical protein
VSKVSILAPRKSFEDLTDDALIQIAAARMLAARRNGYLNADLDTILDIDSEFRPCTPINHATTVRRAGGAMLLGLNPSLFSWSVDTFLSSCEFKSHDHCSRALGFLSEEYNDHGINISFRTLIQGSVCVVGRASSVLQHACEKLGLGQPILGGTIGDIDCNIGGTCNTCGESAALIQHVPTDVSDFQLVANNDEDVVTLNGKRILPSMGSFPLLNEDICTVGSRVFVVLIPTFNR